MLFNKQITTAFILAHIFVQSAFASEAGAQQEQGLPLRGLENKAPLQVYPQLDKSLLITPGLKPQAQTAPLSDMAATKIIAHIDSTNKGRGKLSGIQITLVNDSDRAVLFDGDSARLQCGGESSASAISLSELAALSQLPELTDKKYMVDLKATASAAFTMGWAQTIRDAKQAKGPITNEKGGRYGLEEQRRNDELSRFGKRVLWPSEKTSGVLYFRGPLTGTLVIPIRSYYKNDDCDSIKLSIH